MTQNQEKYGCILKMYKDRLNKRIFSSIYDEDIRNPFGHDRDRIIFSRAFRRLSTKTQIVTAYGKVTSDHLRSRLTHSLEVVQIAKSIAKYVNNKLEGEGRDLRLNYDLIESIALGHDMGHTPYGHIGEEALFKFMFAYDGDNGEYRRDILNSINKEKKHILKKKLRHCFQSLKLCCFLEKHYYEPKSKIYGLNLTLATLDGIFKHSNLNSNEMEFYKVMFESYIKSFYKDNSTKSDLITTLKNVSFDYQSPITYEGIIVAIADEIAQLSHDIEDIRRITRDKDEIEKYYNEIIELFNKHDEIKDIEYNRISIKNIFDDFKEIIDNKHDNLHREYLHTKLIISLAIYAIGEYILKLIDAIKNDDSILKECNLGEFKNILSCANKGKIQLDEKYKLVIEFLDELSKKKSELLFNTPEIAKWDIKGIDLCSEFAQRLYDAICYYYITDNEKKIINYLKVFPNRDRKHLKKSFEAGVEFYDELIKLKSKGKIEYKLNFEDSESIEGKIDMGIKFVVWDWIAGMTDSYVLKEYESFTFKKLDFK